MQADKRGERIQILQVVQGNIWPIFSLIQEAVTGSVQER